MQLNHLNLCVSNVPEACSFFQRCFDLRLLQQHKEALAVLSDEHGFTLVLMNPQAMRQEMRPYPDGFHIGFLLDTPEQVEQTYQRLVAEGVQFLHEPRKIRKSYGFYFTALDDILFEVSCPLSLQATAPQESA